MKKNRRGNVEKVIYTPINSAATRTAALLSGQVDFVLDPAPLDIARLERNASIQVLSRAEDRVMMIALDQYRDQTPYVSDLNGKPLNANPFKDVRVRQALSLAVNREALVRSIMRGKAVATSFLILFLVTILALRKRVNTICKKLKHYLKRLDLKMVSLLLWTPPITAGSTMKTSAKH